MFKLMGRLRRYRQKSLPKFSSTMNHSNKLSLEVALLLLSDNPTAAPIPPMKSTIEVKTDPDGLLVSSDLCSLSLLALSKFFDGLSLTLLCDPLGIGCVIPLQLFTHSNPDTGRPSDHPLNSPKVLLTTYLLKQTSMIIKIYSCH